MKIYKSSLATTIIATELFIQVLGIGYTKPKENYAGQSHKLICIIQKIFRYLVSCHEPVLI